MSYNYNDEDKDLMRISAQAKNKSRIQEMLDFIKVSGFNRIGVANCASMQKYADKLADILKSAGLSVSAVNCKESGLCGENVCTELTGPCCDPIFQADYLNTQGTEFNINVGLCLGHGLIFQKHSKAPVTTFVVKDAATSHKSIENLL